MTADLYIVLAVAAGTLAMRASMITLLADVTIPHQIVRLDLARRHGQRMVARGGRVADLRSPSVPVALDL
jgi:hypothetical protein